MPKPTNSGNLSISANSLLWKIYCHTKANPGAGMTKVALAQASDFYDDEFNHYFSELNMHGYAWQNKNCVGLNKWGIQRCERVPANPNVTAKSRFWGIGL